MHHAIPDVLTFIMNLLDGHLLIRSAQKTAIAYATACTWAQYVRDIFIQWVWEEIIHPDYQLSGVVEIDERLFGRRIKYHKGNPRSSAKVWIVGLVERASGRTILYPVASRSTNTLMLIIKKHVELGSTIYTDGWVGYANINNAGYRHFSVLHSEGYKKKYRNVQTGEIVSVDTNFVEGSWAGAKAHFKRIHGTSIANFESHIAEVIWRNFHKGSPGEVYDSYFRLLSDIYAGVGPARLTAPKPLFPTFQLEPGVDTIKLHPIYDTSHAPPDIHKAVQTIVLDHPYAAVYVPESQDDHVSPDLEQGLKDVIVPDTPEQDEQLAGPSGLAPTTRPGVRHVFMPVGYEEYETGSNDKSTDLDDEGTCKKKKKMTKSKKKQKDTDKKGSKGKKTGKGQGKGKGKGKRQRQRKRQIKTTKEMSR